MAKRFHFSTALLVGLSAGLVSPAAGKMSDARLTIGVQVVEPCTISLDRDDLASIHDRSTVACARHRAASMRTIPDAGSGANMASLSARSETGSGPNMSSRYTVTEVAF
jgi:hypothetical protein